MTKRKTYLPATDTTRTVDATNRILGRLATEIAVALRGKDRAAFAPHKVVGDRVIVTNAQAVKVTGRKLTDKIYYTHSGYIGSLKAESLGDLMKRKPEEVIRRAVWGMLPSNRLRRELMRRLVIFPGEQE
ncbi:50S ribosomal protein L13 [Candidatus Berkelbacteria bacterium]|nr:50S ribosomal protein L13 [Candidatus Berkelbacteria bacterium]